MEIKKITYHIHPDTEPPVVGQYVVGLGKKGILSVSLIKTVRPIKPRVVSEYVKYALELIPRPDLKEFVVVDWYEGGADVWVRGEEALPCFSMPRVTSKQ